MDVLCGDCVCSNVKHPYQLADDMDYSYRRSGQLLAVFDVAIPAKFTSVYNIGCSVDICFSFNGTDLLLRENSSQTETEGFDSTRDAWHTSHNTKQYASYGRKHNQPTTSKRHQDDDRDFCDVFSDVILWNLRLHHMVVWQGYRAIQSRGRRSICRSVLRQRLDRPLHLYNQ